MNSLSLLSLEPPGLHSASNIEWGDRGDKDWDSLVCRSRLGEKTDEVSTIQPLTVEAIETYLAIGSNSLIRMGIDCKLEREKKMVEEKEERERKNELFPCIRIFYITSLLFASEFFSSFLSASRVCKMPFRLISLFLIIPWSVTISVSISRR